MSKTQKGSFKTNMYFVWITLGGPGNMRRVTIRHCYHSLCQRIVLQLCACLQSFDFERFCRFTCFTSLLFGRAIALQTQVIRFHSCHLTLLEIIHKQCALSHSNSCCRESSVMLMCDALHAITAKDCGSPTTIHVFMDRKQIVHISSSK